MSRRPGFWTELDEAALAANLGALRRAVGPRVKIAPVIKGGAYGHGMVRVARALGRTRHAAMFVVGTPDAALTLRRAKITGPVLLVGTWLPDQLPPLLRQGVTPSLFSTECARHVEAAARRLRLESVVCHLRVDVCGSGAGFDPAGMPALLGTLPALPRVRVAAVYTHLFASYTDPAATESALDAFDSFFAALPPAFRRGVIRHAANSPAIFNHPRGRYDMVRPGNALYGLPWSVDEARDDGLQSCLAIKGRVTLVRGAVGTAPWRLGYHSRAHAARRLAVVPAGAAQAPWLLTRAGIDALVRGRRAPVLSSGMEYAYLDVSNIPDAQPGDEAVFLGRQGGEEITVRELMRKTGTDLTLCERLCMSGGLEP